MKISDIDVWVHASSLSKLMTGNFGLSEKQSAKLKTYIERDNANGKPLTARMREEMMRLKDARDNPRIGETGRSYIRKFISDARFEHRDEVTSKQMEHGDAWEHHSIEMLSTMTGIKMNKYEGAPGRDSELMLIGTPDVVTNDFIVDIKNPYNNKTFDDKFIYDHDSQEFIIDESYYWQLQAYMHLFDKEIAYIVYTLNEHKYMDLIGKADHYSQFNLIDRMFIQKLERSRESIERYRERLPAIKHEINLQKEIIKSGIIKTGMYIEEIRGISVNFKK